jgi:hypothetical protein
MGLRDAIIKAVGSAYTALGDIPETATYRRVASVYNPATGANVVTNTDYPILKAIFAAYDNSIIDKINILATDIKLLIQQSELSISPVIATDRVVRTSDGKVFNIIRTSQDPVRSLHILQLRSPS